MRITEMKNERKLLRSVETCPPEFDEAVEFAKCVLASAGFGKDSERAHQLTPEFARHQRLLCMAMSEIAQGREQELIDRAHTDRESFDGLTYAVATHLKEKKPLSPALETWRDENFAEPGPEPAKRHGRPKEPIKKDIIILVVDNLVTMGMNPYRNDASPEELSACDAVAEALVELGAQPRSYFSVKKIYMRRGQLRIHGEQ